MRLNDGGWKRDVGNGNRRLETQSLNQWYYVSVDYALVADLQYCLNETSLHILNDSVSRCYVTLLGFGLERGFNIGRIDKAICGATSTLVALLALLNLSPSSRPR